MSGNGNMQRYSRLATPLHRAVENATRTAFRKRGIAEARLITEWPQIAGEVLAGKTLPKRVAFAKGQKDNGTLHLTVAPGWALEVQQLEPVLLDKIATYFGYRAIAKLHITQAPLPIPTKKTRKAAPAPLPADKQAALDNATASVADADLKAALQSLGEAILRDSARKGV